MIMYINLYTHTYIFIYTQIHIHIHIPVPVPHTYSNLHIKTCYCYSLRAVWEGRIRRSVDSYCGKESKANITICNLYSSSLTSERNEFPTIMMLLIVTFIVTYQVSLPQCHRRASHYNPYPRPPKSP